MAVFEELPELCIAAILSRTTPVDACRLSLVSKTFRSAADSDSVWNQFLPSDSDFIDSIISQSPLLANIPTKKTLYLALSDHQHPIIIDHGKKSFQLERKSGKKCYMLAAGSLTYNNPSCWNWIPRPHSRFPRVAELLTVRWFEIHGMINMLELSPNTQYEAYLVFKMSNNSFGFQNRKYPVEILSGVEGGVDCAEICYFDSTVRVKERQLPIVRSDAWLEIKIGEFFNSGLEDKKFLMNIKEMNQICKRGLCIEGIEVRPKTIKQHSINYI